MSEFYSGKDVGGLQDLRRLLAIIILSTFGCSTLPKGDITQNTFRKENIIPWSIVAFDSKDRGPEERVQMIKELGFSQYAFGGRQRHVDLLPQEIQIAHEHGIKISAVWLYLNDKKDKPNKLRDQNEQILSTIKKAGIHPEIWVGFHPNYFADMTDIEANAKARAMISYLSDRARELGCTLGLYNHGGWMGNPDNQLTIINDLKKDNIGIVYNFHHGHQDIDRYKDLFSSLMPHLLCVNLNGMEKDGKKILPIRSGDFEVEMIEELKKLGYTGPWGILGHVKGGDAKEILKNNYEGLKSLDKP